MLPEPLPDAGYRPAQWARFKKQFQYFLEATEKVDALDKVKITMLLRMVGEKGNIFMSGATTWRPSGAVGLAGRE